MMLRRTHTQMPSSTGKSMVSSKFHRTVSKEKELKRVESPTSIIVPVTVFDQTAKKTYELRETHPWNTILDIKEMLEHKCDSIPQHQRFFFHGTNEIKNDVRLFELREKGFGVKEEDSEKPLVFNLIRKKVFSFGKGDVSLSGTSLLHAPPDDIVDILSIIQSALSVGQEPELASDGSGGTYFLRAKDGKALAAFKPLDEEPGAENNPRGIVGRRGHTSLRKGIVSGEAWKREIAAYILDHGFASVPACVQAEVRHERFSKVKTGSLQVFAKHDEVASDVSSSLFPVEQVHKIALLDLYLMNTDRNDANILVRYGEKRDPSTIELIPIDHGYALPDVLEVGWCDWCWLSWKQIREPLSKKTLHCIKKIGKTLEKDVSRLRKELDIREECLVTLRIMTRLLLRCLVKGGLSIHDVASIASRNDLDLPSELETIVDRSLFIAEKLVAPSGRSRRRHNNHGEIKKKMMKGVSPTHSLSRAQSDASAFEIQNIKLDGVDTLKESDKKKLSPHLKLKLPKPENSKVRAAMLSELTKLNPLRRTHSLVEMSQLQRTLAFNREIEAARNSSITKNREKLRSNLVKLANRFRSNDSSDGFIESFFHCFDNLVDACVHRYQRKRANATL